MKVHAVSDDEDRRLIRDQLDVTVVVEAAAGTGKTTELVERIINLIASGRGTIDRLVAVTFTEKAAGELKLRIRKELERRRQGEAAADAQRSLTAAIQHLEEAHVSTIHGFCADLLRERPVEAGVDPRFSVLSEAAAARIYQEAFRRWLDEHLENPPEGVRRALRRRVWSRDGRDDGDGPIEQLSRAGRELIEWRDFGTPWRRGPFDRDEALARAVRRVHELAELTSTPSSTHDPLYVATDAVRQLSRDIKAVDRLESEFASSGRPRSDTDELDGREARVVDLTRNQTVRRARRGRDRTFAPGLPRDIVWAAFEAMIAGVDEFQRAADCDLAALLHQELQGVVLLYEELKRRAGAVDYLDLLLGARNLLVAHDSVRASFQSRFTHLFVDEFQDTDPLQAEILLLLAADDARERTWRNVRPVPGKLFIVGDPKQAIYRFRRADVETYQEVCDQLVTGGARRAYLHTSFRSTPTIQRAVNGAFSTLMTGDRQTLQADYVALSPYRPDIDQPSVVALPVPEPYGQRRVAGSAIQESLPDAVGAFVAWLLNESGWTVTERTARDELPMSVPVEARHVCVLFRRFLQAGNDVTRPYVEALEGRGIRHLLVGGKSFHEREEIETLRAALSAIEWPDDELSVFATLRGSLLAIDDETLLEYRHAFQVFHPFKVPKAVAPALRPVAESLHLLRRLHRRRNHVPIAETITDLLEATRAHVSLVLRTAGEQALANVLHVAELARQFEANGGVSFRGFVEELCDQAGGGQAAEAPILEEGSDGVRLMTVHKAKGLEFPVVILADMTAKLRSDRADRLIDRATSACYVRLGGWRPAELIAAEPLEVARDEAEGVRVAYVAATRARDVLVVPAVGDVPWEGGWTAPLNRAVYPDASRRRAASAPRGCPAFKKDSVWKRPDDDPATPLTVCPGLHVIGPDGADAYPVVWWDPHALDLDAQPVAVPRETLISKDVPETVVNEGLRDYEAWRHARGEAQRRGQRPSIGVRTVTEWASTGSDMLAAWPGIPAAALQAPVQRGLFEDADEGAQQRRAELATASVEVVDARGPGTGSGPGFGELVHALLATAPLDGDRPTLIALAAVQGRIVGASAEEVDASARLVERVLAHNLLARARAAEHLGRCRRETPITVTLADGSLIEGVVDLAFEEPDGWIVVDYKTDRELGAEEERYRRQIALYVEAVSRAAGAPARGVLVRV